MKTCEHCGSPYVMVPGFNQEFIDCDCKCAAGIANHQRATALSALEAAEFWLLEHNASGFAAVKADDILHVIRDGIVALGGVPQRG
jgi:hypothetical protein